MATFRWLKKVLPFAITLVGVLVAFAGTTFADHSVPHWSYGGTANPTQWGNLDHDFALCEIGRDQSPIDLEDAVAAAPAELAFSYEPVPLVVANTGHTIQVNYAEGSTLSLNGEVYQLLQFHFHTPSEHTTEGQAAAMEVHLVHRNEAGRLAVVGVLIQPGEENPVIERIWQQTPGSGETSTDESTTLNVADLLPGSTRYFSYVGSLTTPPCSEGVRWNVLSEPIQASEAQIEAFQNWYQVNARPTQPTNGRIIEFHGE